MNDRIRDLMAEAGISVEYVTNTKQIVLLEKFAELIVRECIHVMHNQERLPQGFLYAKSASLHEVAIQDHFGVKA